MNDNIIDMKPSGFYSEQGRFDEVGEPDRRYPETVTGWGESIMDTFGFQTVFDKRILKNISVIVIIDKIEIPYLPVNSKYGDG